MRVLICLESTNATTAVVDYLGAHGVDAECADSVDLARRLLRFRRYDALLCEGEGARLARTAKMAHPRTRTVVLSTGRDEMPFGQSIDSLLVKPMPLATILGCLAG
jgi:DNA-binding response OmpR family regulator